MQDREITIPAAGVMQLCALGYSGWFGVGINGVHAGSAIVVGRGDPGA